MITGNAEAIIKWLFEQEREKLFDIKEHKEKRSVTQNAYCWKLIGEIANVARQNKDDVYLDMLRHYGQSEVVSIRADIDVRGYFKYFDEIGAGEVNGKQFKHYRIYKGSSEYDSGEMSILIDGVVHEAENLGICTMTPAEIARLQL